ncbi:serine hydrolase domain-containing protein [Neobacillus sp. D3-1R]|uniref:serine hydrolase domain-containing protein n=1 Tax=Neobacillus sp. D3-1R TaxID=3445778 RepID=UPI003F9F6578
MEKNFDTIIDQFPGINSLIVANQKETIYRYIKEDGKPADIRSLTKTIISVLIGILFSKKQIESMDTSLHYYFIDAPTSITIKHLLNMKSGIHLPDGEMNELAKKSSNWIQDILELPVNHNPDFCYQGVDYHLLSGLITKITKQSALHFANENLFHPLGIKNAVWPNDPSGISLGSTSLQLQAEDLLKIGQLFLNGGLYNNKRIISENWLNKSFAYRVQTSMAYGDYGLGWWIKDLGNHTIIRGLGTGGQQLLLCPSIELAIIITANPKEHSHERTEQITAMIQNEIKK